MDLQVRCPSCKILLKVPANLAGKKIRCTKCEEVVAVPAGGAGKSDPSKSAVTKSAVTTRPAAPKPRPPSDVDDDDDRDERDHRRSDRSRPGRGKRRKAESGKSNTGVFVGIGLGVLGMVAVLIGLIVAMTRSDAPEQAANFNPNPIAVPPQGMFVPQIQGGVDLGAQGMPIGAGNVPNQPNVVNVPPQQAGGFQQQAPLGPLPNEIESGTVQNVKRATVLLRVTMANGQMGEGSGFFALENGLIVTNAHVLGMMQIHSPKPRSVQVVVYSGEPNETTLTGEVLGSDGQIDLAVVRVKDGGGLPPPLRIDSAARLTELQKVYIFGFPLGSALGKNITVAASSVSSLRKDARGNITQLQVNGGIHQGNSGGPVVDARGHVVGISVAIILGTQINFAVPGEFVQALTSGRIRDTEVGAAFRAGDKVKLPVKVYCTDPLRRIRAVNLDVWTAPPGPARLASNVPPAAQSGEANKQTVPLTYKDGIAQAEIEMPTTPPGESLWLQAVASGDAGARLWAATATYRPDEELPLDRVPAKFRLSNSQEAERTLHITGTRNLTLVKGQEQTVIGNKMEMTALEHVQTDARGINVHVHPAEIKQTNEMAGKPLPFAPAGPQIVQRLVFSFLMSPEGAVKERVNPSQLQTLQQPIKTEAETLFSSLANCYEATAVLIPLRQLEPGEMWVATAPLLLNVNGVTDTADMQFSCTYEGRRTSEGKDLGYVRLVGDVRGRSGKVNAGGRVSGYVLFDLVHGFISKAVVVVESDLGGAMAKSSFAIHLEREAGNPKKIAKLDARAALTNVPGAAPAAEIKKGKSLLNISAQITLADPVDKQKTQVDLQKPPGGRFKEHKIMLKAGVTYVIEMTSANPTAFDPYLRLQDDTGKVVSYDDDGGGNMNARIIFTPTKAGQYRIIAMPFLAEQLGSYTLTVSELAK